ncbi:hypothetical protein K1719_008714 [Acacia pycnantha]|nr:hypothetical protein K1719_008714 [Acacia pycnantha]
MKNQQEQQEIVGSLMSPSFSSYASGNLVDIADQVNRDYFRSLEPPDNGFEFVTFQKAADGVFLDGYVGPVFPVFNRDPSTLYESDGGDGRGRERDSRADEDDVMALQYPMRNLMIHDDSDPPSSSSSDGEDLEGIPPGSYCVWTPNSPKASPCRPKKSNSTGSSSKRWKLLDLLRRSNSDGKDSSVFVTPTSSGPNLEKKQDVRGENSKMKKASAHEALYTKNKELSKPNKRRSYLPYRQDLIGFGLAAQFQFLERLLLVHGHWCYRRIAMMICYFFYKNIAFGFTLFWFEAYASFSGQPAYMIGTCHFTYNVYFTSLPVIAMGVFDQDVSARLCLKRTSSSTGRRFSGGCLMVWSSTSLIIFFLTTNSVLNQSFRSDGHVVDLEILGLTMYTCVVWTVNGQMAICSNYFTWIQHFFIWGSIVFWYVFLVVYGYFPPAISTTAYTGFLLKPVLPVVSIGLLPSSSSCALFFLISRIESARATRNCGLTDESSFSSYASGNLVDIADQVNRDYFRSLEPPDNGFEFVTFQKAADGVFLDGYVGPVFPVFNRDPSTLYESDGGDGRGRERDSRADEDDVMALQFPMRNLMIHDDSDPPSSSSSDGEDLEGIPPGSYCVWTPNSPKASPCRPKKSNSTGSSPKRWKLLDLLRRSNSDGKDSPVFVTPTSSGPNLEKKQDLRGENSKVKKASAHEALYTRNKELSKLNKRRSYLPYRQDLIGFGVRVTVGGRALRSF